MLRAVEFEEREGYVSFEGSKVKATELVEPAISLYIVSAKDPFFDLESTQLRMYNNSYVDSDESTHAITITRVTAPDDYPLKNNHPNVYKVHFNTTKTSSPDLGGFVCSFIPRKNGRFEEAFYVKAPVGLRFSARANFVIPTDTQTWLNRETTGDWQETHISFDMNTEDINDDGGHIYLSQISGYDIPEQFDVYVGAIAVLDITDNPDFVYTPLFDPSLGARMTSGGVLSSDQFVEDSALSSVQILRGGQSVLS